MGFEASGQTRTDSMLVHDHLRQVAPGLSIGLPGHSAQRQEQHRGQAHDAHGQSHDQCKGHVDDPNHRGLICLPTAPRQGRSLRQPRGRRIVARDPAPALPLAPVLRSAARSRSDTQRRPPDTLCAALVAQHDVARAHRPDGQTLSSPHAHFATAPTLPRADLLAS